MYVIKDNKSNKNIFILPVKELASDKYVYSNIKIAIGILRNFLEKNKNKSIAIPQFSSKDISWDNIKTIIESELLSIDNEITIYEKE